MPRGSENVCLWGEDRKSSAHGQNDAELPEGDIAPNRLLGRVGAIFHWRSVDAGFGAGARDFERDGRGTLIEPSLYAYLCY
jgi:hypothetical protein